LNDIATPESVTLLRKKKMKPGRSDTHAR
jgi:hypothetical protein